MSMPNGRIRTVEPGPIQGEQRRLELVLYVDREGTVNFGLEATGLADYFGVRAVGAALHLPHTEKGEFATTATLDDPMYATISAQVPACQKIP
jgi:hypothetical protein